MPGTAVILNVGNMQLTLPNALAGPDGNADVFYASIAKAMGFMNQIGSDMKTGLNDVKSDTGFLQEINGVQSWQLSDWNDPAVAVQRTALLTALGALPANAPTTLYISYTDATGQTLSEQFPPSGVQTIDAATARTGYLSGEHPDGQVFLSTPPDQYWVIHGNVDTSLPNLFPVNTLQQAYAPTDADVQSWIGQQKTWTNQMTQLSQDKQVYLQDLVGRLNQFLTWSSNLLQRRESLISEVLRSA